MAIAPALLDGHDFDYNLSGLDLEAENERLQRAVEFPGPVSTVGDLTVTIPAEDVPF